MREILAIALLVMVGMAGALDDPDSVTSIFSGDGDFWSYDSVEAGSTAAKTQLSGTGNISIYKVTEWNATGSVMELSGSIAPSSVGAWRNRYIAGASEDKTGVHRLEMRSLGATNVSTSISVSAQEISSSSSFDVGEAYLENVVETLAGNKTHLSDRSRTYFSGWNASGTFDYMSIVPPGAEGDWLPCWSCVDEFDIQPDWESEDIVVANSTCSDGSCEVDEEDEEIAIS